MVLSRIECRTQSREDAVVCSSLAGLASFSASEGKLERPVELLALDHQHSSTMRVTKDKTQELLSELESELSPDSFAEAMERARRANWNMSRGIYWRGHSGLVLNCAGKQRAFQQIMVLVWSSLLSERDTASLLRLPGQRSAA